MKRQRGFTLLELMIVVIVIAILAAIAISNYQKQVRKSRRAEAKQVLMDGSLREEKWRSNNPKYFGTDSSAANIALFGSLASSTYYTVTITTAESATDYTMTAVPKGDQTSDSCGTLQVSSSSGTLTKSPATSGCWQ
jgi:type IV pilus assembly protein PilE